MATRMKAVGIKATVVGGRVRDLKELKATGLPVSDYRLIFCIATNLCDHRSGPKPALLLGLMPRLKRVLGMYQFQLQVSLFLQ